MTDIRCSSFDRLIYIWDFASAVLFLAEPCALCAKTREINVVAKKHETPVEKRCLSLAQARGIALALKNIEKQRTPRGHKYSVQFWVENGFLKLQGVDYFGQHEEFRTQTYSF